MGKLNVIFLQFLYSTLLCVCPFFSILFYVYFFFIRLNKITKHKSHVHCLIIKGTPLLEKDPKHSIPLFMKRNGCFMLSTFLFGQLQCYSVANHAIQYSWLLYSIKERQNFKNLPVPYVDNGNTTFLGSKIYFQ